jgi:hypothetical protein
MGWSWRAGVSRRAIRSSICLVRTGSVCTGSQTYSAIPAAHRKVLCNPIISSGRPPVGRLSLACRAFFGDRIAESLVKTPLSVVIKTPCPHRDKVSSHSIKPYYPGKSMVMRWRLGGINRNDGSRLLHSRKERFKQLPHGRQGIIIKQSSHPLPQPTFAPQFGPHRLEQRAAQLLDLIA